MEKEAGCGKTYCRGHEGGCSRDTHGGRKEDEKLPISVMALLSALPFATRLLMAHAPLSRPGILKLALEEWPGNDERWDSLEVMVQVTETRGPNPSGLAWLRVSDGISVFQLSFRSDAVNEMLGNGLVGRGRVVRLRGFKRRVVLLESRSVSATGRGVAHLQGRYKVIDSLRGVSLELLENAEELLCDGRRPLDLVRFLPDESFTFGDRRTTRSAALAARLLQRHGTAEFVANLLSHTLVESTDPDHVAAILVGEGMAVQRANPTPLAVAESTMGERDFRAGLWVLSVGDGPLSAMPESAEYGESPETHME